jgi:hypothetical protein
MRGRYDRGLTGSPDTAFEHLFDSVRRWLAWRLVEWAETRIRFADP